MLDEVWRWVDPDGQQRKVRLDELRAALAGGHIAPNTPVWKSGWAGWQPAHDVPELTSASVGGFNGVVLNIPPPPLSMVAVQQEYEAEAPTISGQWSKEETRGGGLGHSRSIAFDRANAGHDLHMSRIASSLFGACAQVGSVFFRDRQVLLNREYDLCNRGGQVAAGFRGTSLDDDRISLRRS